MKKNTLLKPTLILCLLFVGVASEAATLTFYGWSDQHTKTSGDTATLHPFVDAMNTTWPAPRGPSRWAVKYPSPPL